MNALERIDPVILGQRLCEARKASGLTQEEAAKRLGCSRPTFIAVEKGTRRASSDEVIKLANVYGRSVHELVRSGASVVDIEPHLRAAAGSSPSDNSDIAAAVGELQRFVDDYRQLEELAAASMVENYPPEVRIPVMSASMQSDFAEDVATRERSRLNLGDQPILELRQLLENNVGLRIFLGSIPSHIAGMYAYIAEVGYCILLNAKHPHERRRWTLAHEYGHFLVDRHKPGIDYLGTARMPTQERFVEAFARSFLMPATGVRRHFYDIQRSRGDFQVMDLCRLSHFYQASVQAMTLRLESLALLGKGTWDRLNDQGFRPEAAKRQLELPLPNATEEPYPERYKYLAISAFLQEKISEGRLAKFLRVDRLKARAIVADCLQHADDLGPDGSPGQWEFADRSLLEMSS